MTLDSHETGHWFVTGSAIAGEANKSANVSTEKVKKMKGKKKETTHATIEEMDDKEEHIAFSAREEKCVVAMDVEPKTNEEMMVDEEMKMYVVQDVNLINMDEESRPENILSENEGNKLFLNYGVSGDRITYDEHIAYYDWLADSTTTSHITNQQKALLDYRPVDSTSVAGVRNAKATVKGCGSVELESTCQGQKYVLWLNDVLYVPANRNNVLSLGRWDNAGRRYVGKGGKIALINEAGKPVMMRIQVKKTCTN